MTSIHLNLGWEETGDKLCPSPPVAAIAARGLAHPTKEGDGVYKTMPLEIYSSDVTRRSTCVDVFTSFHGKILP